MFYAEEDILSQDARGNERVEKSALRVICTSHRITLGTVKLVLVTSVEVWGSADRSEATAQTKRRLLD